MYTPCNTLFTLVYRAYQKQKHNLEGGHSYTCGYEPIATSSKPRPKTEKGLAKKYF